MGKVNGVWQVGNRTPVIVRVDHAYGRQAHIPSNDYLLLITLTNYSSLIPSYLLHHLRHHLFFLCLIVRELIHSKNFFQ